MSEVSKCLIHRPDHEKDWDEGYDCDYDYEHEHEHDYEDEDDASSSWRGDVLRRQGSA
jgi:hypothetical protein